MRSRRGSCPNSGLPSGAAPRNPPQSGPPSLPPLRRCPPPGPPRPNTGPCRPAPGRPPCPSASPPKLPVAAHQVGSALSQGIEGRAPQGVVYKQLPQAAPVAVHVSAAEVLHGEHGVNDRVGEPE